MAKLHPLAQKLWPQLTRLDLEAEGILVAVSGGPDSLALLRLLAELRPLHRSPLVAAHIDHGLRPLETPAEWALVQETCRHLDIPAVRQAVDVREMAASQKMSMEHAARELRYQELTAIQEEQHCRWLALAHTADDQVEELLIRLLRGGGGKALSGMRMQAGTRIRPLLKVRKAELLQYLADIGQAFAVDSTNHDPAILRNRIRLHLLPLLEQDYDSGVRRALLKSADILAEDEALLEELRDNVWNAVVTSEGDRVNPGWRVQLAAFLTQPPALQRRLLERLLYTAQGAAEYRHIMAIRELAAKAEPGKVLHLNHGLRVRKSRSALHLSFPFGRTATRTPGKRSTPPA